MRGELADLVMQFFRSTLKGVEMAMYIRARVRFGYGPV